MDSSASTFRLRAERQRSPTGSGHTNDQRNSWSTANLTQTQLAAVFDTLHEILEHVPYAICGLGALVDHGFATRRVSRVSIVSPAYAKDNVRAWLATRGFVGRGDSVGIPFPADPSADAGAGVDGVEGGVRGEGQVCRVRIKYLDEGFEKLERTRSSMSSAIILGLASQLDHAAAGFVERYRVLKKLQAKSQDLQPDGDEGDRNSYGNIDSSMNGDSNGRTSSKDKKIKNTDPETEEKALRAIAKDIFFLLDKAVRTRHRLEPRLLPTLLGEEFWTPFTERYDEARPELARAGVDVAGVLARHRDLAAVREHEDMLRQYGVLDRDGSVGVGEEAEQQQGQGPFDKMRSLAHQASVYTLKPDGDSILGLGELDNISLPPMPALPSPLVPAPLFSRAPASSAQKNQSQSRQEGLEQNQKAENKFLTRLIPRRSNSVRERSSEGHGLKSEPRDGKAPPKRFSEEIERNPADWI
ncbi:hypothetical protein GGR54DRAFT_98447 [Hypoxylon sp. NC1633]|nr:hypothetical protein GGR54DRAFT_98447 [Hypoxylon sp. NC1633]